MDLSIPPEWLSLGSQSEFLISVLLLSVSKAKVAFRIFNEIQYLGPLPLFN